MYAALSARAVEGAQVHQARTAQIQKNNAAIGAKRPTLIRKPFKLAPRRIRKRNFSTLGGSTMSLRKALQQSVAQGSQRGASADPTPPSKRAKLSSQFRSMFSTLAHQSGHVGHASPWQPPLKKGQKHCQFGSIGSQTPDADLGHVLESWTKHAQRHQHQINGNVQALKCLRCLYTTNKLQPYAKMPLNQNARAGTETWLDPRPGQLGGQWGLGCRICAWHRQSHVYKRRKDYGNKSRNAGHVKRGAVHKGGAPARFSKFAYFTWRNSAQFAKTLEQHGCSERHKAALRAYQAHVIDYTQAGQPLAATNVSKAFAKPQASQEEALIFKGRVPQLEGWRSCFAEASHFISYHKQAKLSSMQAGEEPAPDTPQATLVAPNLDNPGVATEGPQAGQALATPTGPAKSEGLNLRKRRRKQARIIAEVVRRRHRGVLRKARFCSIALDEAQGRKLVRFRCDFHKPPWSYSGTLGVFSCGARTLGEGAEDHAQRAMTRLDEFITKFSTPLRKASLGTECDQELKDHLLKIVKTISADGGPAERRAIFLACQPGFPGRVELWHTTFHSYQIISVAMWKNCRGKGLEFWTWGQHAPNLSNNSALSVWVGVIWVVSGNTCSPGCPK